MKENPQQHLQHQLILGIETSCDETSVSLVEAKTRDGKPLDVRVLAHLVHSQFDIHKAFGGVVPEIAARDHLAKLPELAAQAFALAKRSPDELSAVAATAGPGLIGAVMVGYLFAQGLAEAAQVPLRAINHVDAHLAPATLLDSFDLTTDLGQSKKVRDFQFPRISLTVSGGHCLLAFDEDHGKRNILGTTLDDACGEAFDKVAKLLGLPAPGGPNVEKMALQGDTKRFSFAKPLAGRDDFSFSFSGLKTAVLRAAQDIRSKGKELSEQDTSDLCACFQEVALSHLCNNLVRAHEKFGEAAKEIVIAGGVAANQQFRKRVAAKLKGIPHFFAPQALCNDNATMIALQSLLCAQDGKEVFPFARYVYAGHVTSRASTQKQKAKQT